MSGNSILCVYNTDKTELGKEISNLEGCACRQKTSEKLRSCHSNRIESNYASEKVGLCQWKDQFTTSTTNVTIFQESVSV